MGFGYGVSVGFGMGFQLHREKNRGFWVLSRVTLSSSSSYFSFFSLSLSVYWTKGMTYEGDWNFIDGSVRLSGLTLT